MNLTEKSLWRECIGEYERTEMLNYKNSCDLEILENAGNYEQLSYDELVSEIKALTDNFFGKDEWAEYYGEIEIVPALPRNICKILASDCPFFKGKTVGKTHMLVLIPETVSGIPMNLDLVSELAPVPKKGNKAAIACTEESCQILKDRTVEKAHWVLLTTELLHGTRRHRYDCNQLKISLYPHYTVPLALETTICLLVKFVKTGKFFDGEQFDTTFTRCQEQSSKPYPDHQILVGSLSADKILITYSSVDNEFQGVAGMKLL